MTQPPRLPGFIAAGPAATALFAKSKESRASAKDAAHAANILRAENPEDPQNKYDPDFVVNSDELWAAFEAHDWRFAKTMPERPHSYTLRKNWTSCIPFENAVHHLLETGAKAWYVSATGRKYPNTYWVFNGYRFWNGPYPDGCPMRTAWLINKDLNTPTPYVIWGRE